MKKFILLSLIGSLVVSISMGILMATNNAEHQVFSIDRSGQVKLTVQVKENKFFLEDENRTYDLFKPLLLQLYKGDDKLYKDSLGSVKILSISKKYSDREIYMIKYEFSVFRCAQDVTEVCETDRGASRVELYLGKENFNEPLTILSMPEIEILALW
jgi:hypothetical protein